MIDQGGSGTRRPRVSGITTCFNEQANIEACLDSLQWCDEIVVVDSFSTDRTPEIAKGRDGVRFFQRKYCGGAAQKNWAIREARFEWIMILDADERCGSALRREILELLESGPKCSAYNTSRRISSKVAGFVCWDGTTALSFACSRKTRACMRTGVCTPDW